MAPFRLLVTIFIIFVSEVKPARILVLIPIGTKSHTSGFEPLHHELAKRGHQVTIVTNFLPSKSIPNVRYVQNFDPQELQASFDNRFEKRLRGDPDKFFDFTDGVRLICKKSYERPEVLKLLEEDFDLVMLNSFMIFGNPVTTSMTPLYDREFSDGMTFVQRLQNFVQTLQYYYLRNYYHIPKLQATYRSFSPHAPSVQEIEKRIDLILINSHPIINFPRALLPNIIETSGLQLKDGGKLPKELQEFVDGAGEDGFIYFSFGSFTQGSGLPPHIRMAFLRVFGKLKQRVIWKFETEEIENLPPNVKLGKWFPQQNLLAQPSIRLFITHGGLLSVQEAVYHGVPLIGIPLFGDQDGNLEQAFQRGISLTLNLEDINDELIIEKITKVLRDDSFKVKARQVSEAFRDRPMPPLETAIYWTEYLLRHNNTSHLHSAGRHLHSIQYHSLDVITILAVTHLGVVYAVIKFLKFIIYRLQFLGSVSKGAFKKDVREDKGFMDPHPTSSSTF